MARVNKPPTTPQEMEELINGQGDTPADAPTETLAPAIGSPAAAVDDPSQLPKAKIGQKCKVLRGDGSSCPGKLTPLGGHFPDRKSGVVRTTLVCSKCGMVQGKLEVAMPT